MATVMASMAGSAAKTMAIEMLKKMIGELVPLITGKMKEIIAENREQVCDAAQTDALIDSKAAELEAYIISKIPSLGGRRFRRSTRRHHTRGTRRRINQM